MTLYEICEKLRYFEFDIDEETGEILNADDLDKLEMARDEKIENICLYIKNLRAEADALKAEKEIFEKREKAAKNRILSLTSYLERMLGGDAYKSLRATVSYRESESVECTDMEVVPTEFIRMKAPELDKALVKKALKAGIEVKGCQLVKKQNIQIK